MNKIFVAQYIWSPDEKGIKIVGDGKGTNHFRQIEHNYVF